MAMVRKNEYVAVDLGKLICSFMVMAIHFRRLQECGNIFYTIFVEGFCRFAVPFFFACSGFFVANKTNSFENTYGYIVRIFKLYIVYSLVNSLLIYRQYQSISGLLKKLILFFRDFFFLGSYLQLWYLLALMYAVGLLYIFVHYFKLDPDTLLGLGIVIYIIGIVVNWLMENPCGVVVVDKLISAYSYVFATTGNGLFIGFPYVVIGYYFRVREVHCPIKYSFWCFLGACSLFIWAKLSLQVACFGRDIIWSGLLMLGTAALFISLKDMELTINLSYFAQKCRNISTVIFGTHMVVKVALQYLLELCRIKIDPALEYILAILAVIVVGNSVVILSKRVKMLNNLY